MKQSIKAYKPRINELIPFNQFITKQNDIPGKFIAYCSDDKKDYLFNAEREQSNFLLLIGPEGDFNKEEIENALKSGFKPVSLGNSRLRTETAGVVACQIIATRLMMQ
jgi:16S rRNA (uracil1498-N3)-methyltransferase